MFVVDPATFYCKDTLKDVTRFLVNEHWSAATINFEGVITALLTQNNLNFKLLRDAKESVYNNVSKVVLLNYSCRYKNCIVSTHYTFYIRGTKKLSTLHCGAFTRVRNHEWSFFAGTLRKFYVHLRYGGRCPE